MYVVYYSGMYELDEDGYNVIVTRTFDTLEEASASANEYTRETDFIPNIEFIG